MKLHENHPDIEKLKHSSLEFQSSNYLTNLPMLQASATADQFFGSSQQNQKPPAVPGSKAVVDPAYSPFGIQTCSQTPRLKASPKSHITCICDFEFVSSKLRDTCKFEQLLRPGVSGILANTSDHESPQPCASTQQHACISLSWSPRVKDLLHPSVGWTNPKNRWTTFVECSG